MPYSPVRGLYAIVDAQACTNRGLELLRVAQAILLAQPACLQLRAKNEEPRTVLGQLRALRAAQRALSERSATQTGSPPTLIFGNDRPDVADLAGCDGVHLGQHDLPISQARRFAPGLKLGISTHDSAQLKQALKELPDYVAFGPVFETGSKQDPDPVVGLQGLAQAHAECRAARIPLVAIGGVTLDNAAQVAQNSDSAAVIGALLPGSEVTQPYTWITQQCRRLHAALGGAT